MVKFIQRLEQTASNEFTLLLDRDPSTPDLGGHPEWSIFTRAPLDLGNIPSFLSENDPRSAIEQLHEAYSHAGGWLPVSGFKRPSAELITEFHPLPSMVIHYPGDPLLYPLAGTTLRDEAIIFYHNAWVGVFAPDETFEVARLN